MTTTRRRFIQTAALAGSAIGLRAATIADEDTPAKREGGRRGLNLLILGGTSFIGPHIVERALERGHRMTLFNRGRTNPSLFPQLEKLRGDRDPDKGEGLNALVGRKFDGVIDTSGHFPRLVRASARLLGEHAKQYVYISSLSVYPDFSKIGISESDPVATMEDETIEEFGDQFQYYGPLKALCEKAAEAAMPGRTTAIRPGLIVGPRDNVPRFTYWPVRVRRGGEVLSPGSPSDPVQYIDGRDLAAFVIKVLEDKTMGSFNTNGPSAPTNIAEVLYGCKAVTGGDARFTWVDADFLTSQQVAPWSHMPLWIPPTGEYAGFHRVDVSKAQAAGLTSRPLAETVRDTLAWFDAWPQDKPFPWRGGIEPERERAVLAAWHARDQKSGDESP